MTHLADLALKSNDAELSKTYLNRALDVDPNLADVHYHLGLLLYTYASPRPMPSSLTFPASLLLRGLLTSYCVAPIQCDLLTHSGPP